MRFPIRVYFEDTDFSGRVYHGAYVRFLERARTEFVRDVGLDHKLLAALPEPLFFALRALEMNFLAPATIDDMIEIETAPEGEVRAAIWMRQTIYREDVPIVRARVELCLIDTAGRPRRPPPLVRAAFGRAADGVQP